MKNNEINADELWNVAWTYIKTIVDTLRDPFLILDKNLRILSANRIFYLLFQVNHEETEGQKVYDLGNGQWNIPKLKTLLEDILPKNTFFEDFKVEHSFQKIGKKTIVLNARRIYTIKEEKPIILLAMQDITRQIELEDKMKTYTKELALEVAKRTAELKVRVMELERMNKIMVGREIKMIELKAEIKRLKQKK